MAFQFAIVLTGGIASGKSTVGEYFRSFGWEVIDADKVAHQLLDTYAKEIAKMFGSEVLFEGKVERKVLGAMVFNQPSKRAMLENFLHPLIYEAIERQSEALDRKKEPYLIEIPLFFETSRYPIATSIVVYVPKEIQIKRLMQRDGLTQEAAKQRVEIQLDIEKKRQKATYIIENMETKESLYQASMALKNTLEGKYL